MQETEFEIDRNAVRKYFVTTGILASLIPFSIILFWGLFILFAVGQLISIFLSPVVSLIFVLIAAFVLWLCPKQANNLRYRLEGNTLRADSGVFFLWRKSIPLERITDIVLFQGPLMRHYGIWAMRIQTAGSAQCEATLYGVREPEKIRELILAQRKSIYGEKSEDA